VKVETIEIHELKLDLLFPFETSFARVDYQRFLLLKVRVDGVSGWSECVADEAPSYSSETVRTAWHVIEDFIAPAVFGQEYSHPQEIVPSLGLTRGHNMAKAAVEMACWDAHARQQGKSLSQSLGGTRTEIESGVSIGIQESVGQLLEKIESELASGYRRIKVKVKPGWDRDVVAQIRERFPDTPLMVDANSAYGLEDLPLFKELDRFDLMMIEQPFAYDDIWDHAKLQREIRTPICLDESIHSPDDARKAFEMGACRIINIKAGRVGGLARAKAVHDVAASHGAPVWCGGMLESGVGRAHNVHLSTLANFSLPGDVADSKRYFKEEIIEPRVEVRSDGTIAVPTDPGIGYRVLEDRVRRHSLQSVVLKRARSLG
jgi:O-succinylbenzoate synthase